MPRLVATGEMPHRHTMFSLADLNAISCRLLRQVRLLDEVILVLHNRECSVLLMK